MAVSKKLTELTIQSGKYISTLAFSPLSIIYSAIEAEKNKTIQLNMNSRIEELFNEIEDFKTLLLKELDPSSNKSLLEIMNVIGKEFEDIRRNAYSYLLVHVLKEDIAPDNTIEILYQLEQLNAKDLALFKKFYEEDIQLQKETRDVNKYDYITRRFPNITPEMIRMAEKHLGTPIENFNISGNMIPTSKIPIITKNKLQLVGLINIPKYVHGKGDLSDFYQPTLSDKARYLYEYALIPPR